MIITTTQTIEDRAIKAYMGVIVGEAIMGANVFRDLFAGVRNIIGGRSGGYEKELEKARSAAFQDLQTKAAALQADAVVGVDLDYEVITGTSGGSMMLVSISGTAVKTSPLAATDNA